MDRFVRKKRKLNNGDTEVSTDNSDWINENDKSYKQEYLCERRELRWRKYSGENLDLDFCLFYAKQEADTILSELENQCDWNTGRAAEVLIFGKWHKIPRQQAAYGDRGLSYTFSGNTVPAKPWIPLLSDIRDRITAATGHHFNFVLINRYKDGRDHIGEHRDDEKDLVKTSPIASLSFGQTRDFVLKHADCRGKNAKRKIEPVRIQLTHGSLLMMNYPTNVYWYHSIPVRKNATGVRINLTFRDFVTK